MVYGVSADIGTAEYDSAKEALRALTRTAARAWAQYGISATGSVRAHDRGRTAVFAQNAALEVMADAANPMGRLGDPERHIAPIAVFLASDDSRYLTGTRSSLTAVRTAMARRRLPISLT